MRRQARPAICHKVFGGTHAMLVGQPVASAPILTYVLGPVLLISGIVRIMLGISHWREAGWIMLLPGAFLRKGDMHFDAKGLRWRPIGASTFRFL